MLTVLVSPCHFLSVQHIYVWFPNIQYVELFSGQKRTLHSEPITFNLNITRSIPITVGIPCTANKECILV
jgi:hypothetical protein